MGTLEQLAGAGSMLGMHAGHSPLLSITRSLLVTKALTWLQILPNWQ